MSQLASALQSKLERLESGALEPTYGHYLQVHVTRDKRYQNIPANLNEQLNAPLIKRPREPFNSVSVKAALTMRQAIAGEGGYKPELVNGKKKEKSVLILAAEQLMADKREEAKRRRAPPVAVVEAAREAAAHIDVTMGASSDVKEEEDMFSRRGIRYQREQASSISATGTRGMTANSSSIGGNARERREAMERLRESNQEEQEKARGIIHIVEPIVQRLWDIEFKLLNGTNPFRVVLDVHTCAAMGIPDYCEIIRRPMNLTWMKQRCSELRYTQLWQLEEDVGLIVTNALTYNSDASNPVHLAAIDLRKAFKEVYSALVTPTSTSLQL
jgi:hypothetical protein